MSKRKQYDYGDAIAWVPPGDNWDHDVKKILRKLVREAILRTAQPDYFHDIDKKYAEDVAVLVARELVP